MLRIEFSNFAKRFLKKCEREIYGRIIEKIRRLRENAFPSDSVRIKGRKEKLFRIRIRDYRVLYEVYSAKDLILISEIGKRGKVYD